MDLRSFGLALGEKIAVKIVVDVVVVVIVIETANRPGGKFDYDNENDYDNDYDNDNECNERTGIYYENETEPRGKKEIFMKDVTRLLVLIGAVILVSVALSGCKGRDGEVKTYRTDKAPPAPPAVQVDPIPQPSAAMAPPQQTGPYVWDLPEGWIAQPGSGMRLATFLIPVGGTQVECTVIPAGGDVVGNVIRWRGQIGLPAIDAAAVQSSAIKVEGQLGEFQYFKLINKDQPDTAFLAAILPAGARSLFIKIGAPAAHLDSLESSFVDFCKSVKRP